MGANHSEAKDDSLDINESPQSLMPISKHPKPKDRKISPLVWISLKRIIHLNRSKNLQLCHMPINLPDDRAKTRGGQLKRARS